MVTEQNCGCVQNWAKLHHHSVHRTQSRHGVKNPLVLAINGQLPWPAKKKMDYRRLTMFLAWEFSNHAWFPQGSSPVLRTCRNGWQISGWISWRPKPSRRHWNGCFYRDPITYFRSANHDHSPGKFGDAVLRTWELQPSMHWCIFAMALSCDIPYIIID